VPTDTGDIAAAVSILLANRQQQQQDSDHDPPAAGYLLFLSPSPVIHTETLE
jgi:hypothetical protein